MTTAAPVEVTTRHATTVDDLPAAWAFVMDRLEQVGPDPDIRIQPVWIVGLKGEDIREFEVVVMGTVEEPTP